jgi:hypothetical protein
MSVSRSLRGGEWNTFREAANLRTVPKIATLFAVQNTAIATWQRPICLFATCRQLPSYLHYSTRTIDIASVFNSV